MPLDQFSDARPVALDSGKRRHNSSNSSGQSGDGGKHFASIYGHQSLLFDVTSRITFEEGMAV
jgi:hypothetical protein